jgi:ectoine hydroxylase-related dioxygenase (phytanoyl-CoA dioxygenase family)
VQEIHHYSTIRFPFARLVAEHFQTADLSTMHDGVEYPLLTRDSDQGTIFHKHFYTIGNEFCDVYRHFVCEVIATITGANIVYQRVPTFRIHLPNNVSVGEFHRDRDYFHDPAEINFWLPLTRAWGNNTVWIESSEGKEDFRPYELEYGEFLMFDGANLKHGNRINDTGFTRVSIDFRAMSTVHYYPSDRRTINSGMRFIIGEFFEKL